MHSFGKPGVKSSRAILKPTSIKSAPQPWMIRPVDEQGNVTVSLSSKTTSITLPQDPGRALGHFLTNGRKWISWSELRDAGVSDPEAAVRELEALGASFQRKTKDMVTSTWEIHEDAPYYKLLGLHINTTVLGFNTITKEPTHDHVATTKFANDSCNGGAQ